MRRPKLLALIFVTAVIPFLFAYVYSQDNPPVGAEKKDEKKQEKKQKKVLSKVPVELKLALTVTDTDGKLLDDVEAADIKLFEDGIEQKITNVDRKKGDLNVVLEIDNSGSARLGLQGVILRTKLFIENLSGSDKAFVIRFVASDTIEIIQEWTSDKSKLKEAVDNLHIDGGQTAILDAVYLAVDKAAEDKDIGEAKRNTVLVISDFDDRASFYRKRDVIKLIKEKNISVFCWVIDSPIDSKLRAEANALALEFSIISGGGYYMPDTQSSGVKMTDSELIGQILSELRSNFVISYTSDNRALSYNPRNIKIEISDGPNGQKRLAKFRENIVVPIGFGKD